MPAFAASRPCATLPVAEVRLLADAQAAIGESPVWSGDRLVWTDPVRRQRLSWSAAEGLSVCDTECAIWSLALDARSALVGTSDGAFCDGEGREGSTAPLAAGCRVNDMAVDPDGGLWAGAMHRGVLAGRGSIFYTASLDRLPVQVFDGLGVPNGMKFAPDGKTLFVIDTLYRTLLAYPVSCGTLSEPSIVTDFLGLPGKPDGMDLAADGSFWVAMWGGGCVAHIAPDGAMLRLIDLPAPHVSSLCVAGENRLFVTTSRMRLSPEALAARPGSGGLFEIVPEPGR
jgi:sugar lactone lactonase YvrE